MNRFHVHLNVLDLEQSVRFYSALFAAEPSVLKHDYAKWMLDDPRVNFAVSTTGRAAGIDHLGIQAQTREELEALGRRLDAAGEAVLPEPGAVCCYATSDKAWTQDPQGTRWETFYTYGDATSYYAKDAACSSGETACGTNDAAAAGIGKKSSCCATAAAACC